MEKDNINCENMNIIKGEINNSGDNIENLKQFIKRWESKIEEIKDSSYDNHQSFYIAQDFINESIKFLYKDNINNKTLLLDQVSNDLSLALFKANYNYKKTFPSFWNFLSKLKLPDMHFHPK